MLRYRGILWVIGGMMLLANSSHAEIYKWTDINGKSRFSDLKPSQQDAEIVETKPHHGDWKSFDIQINDISQQLTVSERQKIVGAVNTIYWFYDRVLYFDMYKTVPVNVTVLPDEQRYYQYLLSRLGKPAPRSLGIYLRKYNEIVVYIHKTRASTFRTIQHEVSHALVDTVTPYTPSWLNEGLAEQMEQIVERDGEKRVYENQNDFKRVQSQFKIGQLDSLQTILSMKSTAWVNENRNGNYRYQQYTGVFCYFLLTSVQGKNLLTRLIHNYERGDRTFAYLFIDKSYTGGVGLLESHWQAWLRGSGSVYVSF